MNEWSRPRADGPWTPPCATYDVCGIALAAMPPFIAAKTLAEAGASGRALQVHLCNAYTLSLVDRDEKLLQALSASQLNLPDGAPVAWLGRAHGVTGPVRGPSLIREVARLGVTSGLRHYFYGGSDDVATAVGDHLRLQLPDLRIVGRETPPYHDLDAAELSSLADRVRASGAQVLWIGLGTPRQDHLVARLAVLLKIVIVPIGAAFDFLSGRVREAPVYLQGSGLEWMYRLKTEPHRLWRRYLIGNPRFMAAALRHVYRRTTT